MLERADVQDMNEEERIMRTEGSMIEHRCLEVNKERLLAEGNEIKEVC